LAGQEPSDRRRPQTQDLEIGGKPYILVAKSEFERLCLEANLPRENVAAIAKASAGADLRARRREAGLTLTATADMAGIAPETLSRIEHGRTNPTVSTVRAILRALGQND
jgi:DNA-binding XRE family transcriptional regulator